MSNLQGNGKSQAAWYDKYRVDTSHINNNDSNCKITIFDFTSVKEIPPEDWAAVQEVERRARAARPEALRRAELALYRNVDHVKIARDHSQEWVSYACYWVGNLEIGERAS